MGVSVVVEVVAASGGGGIEEVGKRAVGIEFGAVFVEGEAVLEELASGEIVLVFGAADVSGLNISGIRQLRTLRRQEGVLIVKVVGQKAAGENVAAGDVGLKLGEIAEAPDVIVVGIDGQCNVDEIVVLAVEGVVEPDLSLLDGAGESEARQELVEAPSMFVLQGGKKIGGGEAEMIVADAGVEAEQAAGAFAIFGGLARGLDLNVAESVGADADQELSVGGLSHVETVEQSDGLVGLGSGHVGLADIDPARRRE